MDDHPLPSAAAGAKHNGWRAGHAVTLLRGPLAGLRGRLVECNGQNRWLLSLDCCQRGVFVAVQAEDLLLRQEPGERQSGDHTPFAPS